MRHGYDEQINYSWIKQAAKQLEGLFMQELMKSMRASTIATGMLDNQATDMATSPSRDEQPISDPINGNERAARLMTGEPVFGSLVVSFRYSTSETRNRRYC